MEEREREERWKKDVRYERERRDKRKRHYLTTKFSGYLETYTHLSECTVFLGTNFVKAQNEFP